MRLTWFRLNVALIATGWLLGFVQIGLYILSYRSMPGGEVPWSAVLWNWLHYGLGALALPWLVSRAQAVPLDRERWLRQLPAHLARALAIAAGAAVVYGALRKAAEALSGEPYELQRLTDNMLRGVLLSDFYLYAAISVGASAVQAALLRRESEVAAARLESELATTRVLLLKAQLDPHFLFNTLNAVSSLLWREPETADRMISRLSDYLRLLLGSAGSEELALGTELEHAAAYVEIQKARFRDRLEFEVQAADDLLGLPVPHLILQPLIENAIEHGSMPRHTLHVVVRAEATDDRLQLTVEDDGRGLDGAPRHRPGHHGVGLANTRARVRTLFGDEAALELVARPGGGAIARLTVPRRAPLAERAP